MCLRVSVRMCVCVREGLHVCMCITDSELCVRMCVYVYVYV